VEGSRFRVLGLLGQRRGSQSRKDAQGDERFARLSRRHRRIDNQAARPASERAGPGECRERMSRKASTLERDFYSVWRSMFRSQPKPRREFRFHQTRQWRIDFAWPAYRVAVEVDGGIFLKRGHVGGVQFAADAEKHNAMVMMGWRLLRYTTVDMRKRPVQVAEEVVALLKKIQPRELAEQQELFSTEF